MPSEDRISQLDDELTRLLRRMRHPQVRRRLTAGLDDPLERGPHSALVRVALDEPVRLSDLAASLDLDVSTASRQVRTLLDAGLATRGDDPSDGRACRLSTTPAGRSRLAEMRSARRQALADVLAGWSAADVERLAELLSRFVDDLEAAVRQPSG
jgi:DNA-binding MarR family transcriptional regulator